jgi:hypothetical protein
MNAETIVRGLFYRNCNGYAMAAVAVLNLGIDWVVYIGGCPVELSEKDAYRWVAEHGDKLSNIAHKKIIAGLLDNGGFAKPDEPYRY